MLYAGVGLSSAANVKIAATEAASAALEQAGLERAQGALVFASSAYCGAYPLMLRAVAGRVGTREVAGCSGAGIIGAGRESESGPAVVVMVLGGSLEAHRLFVPTLRGRAAEVGGEIAAAVRPHLGANNLLCLFPDTYNSQDAGAMLEAIERELPGVVLIGGGASEDGSIGETSQFCGEDAVGSNAVAGMLLAGEFDIDTAASLACTPIGPPHRVTAVRDNVIFSLDGRPAYEVFSEAVGPLTADLRRAMAFVFVAVPLDPDAPRLERGRYLVRNIVGVSAEHGVIAVGHRFKVGDTCGLLLRDGERARADLKIALEELRAAGRAPACGLFFNCGSRGTGLYGIPDHDSAYIRQYLGAVPMAGFFTGFEIGPLAARPAMLLYSGVIALLSARSA